MNAIWLLFLLGAELPVVFLLSFAAACRAGLGGARRGPALLAAFLTPFFPGFSPVQFSLFPCLHISHAHFPVLFDTFYIVLQLLYPRALVPRFLIGMFHVMQQLEQFFADPCFVRSPSV